MSLHEKADMQTMFEGSVLKTANVVLRISGIDRRAAEEQEEELHVCATIPKAFWWLVSTTTR